MGCVAIIIGNALLIIGAASLYFIGWYKLASYCRECVRRHHNCEAITLGSALMLYTGAGLIFIESVI